MAKFYSFFKPPAASSTVHTYMGRDCEIRLGVASWDDGSNTAKSVKYTGFTKSGKAKRWGEFPVEALPQMLNFAIQKGYVILRAEDDESRK